MSPRHTPPSIGTVCRQSLLESLSLRERVKDAAPWSRRWHHSNPEVSWFWRVVNLPMAETFVRVVRTDTYLGPDFVGC